MKERNEKYVLDSKYMLSKFNWSEFLLYYNNSLIPFYVKYWATIPVMDFGH